MLISEIKFDESFPDSQLKYDGFSSPHRVDRNDKGGKIMLLFRDDLPVKALSFDKGNESCYVEVILKKTKWLMNYSHNPIKKSEIGLVHFKVWTYPRDWWCKHFDGG